MNETIRHAEVRQHCPHRSGAGHGWETKMFHAVVCCQCGAQGEEEVVRIIEQLKGHGPHFKNIRWQSVGITWADDTSSCSG